MNSIVKYMLENDTLLIGISELSKMCEVSPRQLRYWEEKGFIQSVSKEDNEARKYRLPTVMKVELIKKFLDDGFKLTKAVEKAEFKINNIHHIRSFAKQGIQSIDVIDDNQIELTMGPFESENESMQINNDLETKKMTYTIKNSEITD